MNKIGTIDAYQSDDGLTISLVGTLTHDGKDMEIDHSMPTIIALPFLQSALAIGAVR